MIARHVTLGNRTASLPTIGFTVNTMSNYDPTHTVTLRASFQREINKRFLRIRGKIRRKVVDNDCFGLSPSNPMNTHVSTYRNEFAFNTTAAKVDAFMEWLKKEMDGDILGSLPGMGNRAGIGLNHRWTDMYIESSYQRGIARARAELIGRGADVPTIEAGGGLHAVFNQPQHADRAGILFSRTFTELRNVTNAMDSQISKVLTQGIIDGKGPREVARLLNKTISGAGGTLELTDTLGRFIPAQRRAQMIARTEIIRAHHVATVQEYRNWGVVGVTVRAEFKTAGDSRVCEECASLEGRKFTLDEIENVIPVHPQCRCVALPDVLKENTNE